MNESGKFLIVRLGSLGDLVHTLPAMAALRSSFRDARLDWVVEAKWVPLLELVDGLNQVIPLERSVRGELACIRRLRRERYGCVVDFQGLYKSAVLAWCSGARRRIGFSAAAARESGAAWFYTDRITPKGRHVTDKNLSLAVCAGAELPGRMAFPLRVPEREVAQLRGKLSKSGITDYVAVSPGGGWTGKCWPPDRYGALCGELWRRHRIRAVVNVGPKEEGLGRAVVRASGSARPVVVTATLPELVALVSQARVVIGADTGPVHLASALGTQVIALFGPTDPIRNGPMPRGVVLRNVTPDAPSYKRSASYSTVMLSITVDQVLSAVEQEMRVRA